MPTGLVETYSTIVNTHFDRIIGKYEHPAVGTYCNGVRQLGDPVPARMRTFGELTRDEKKNTLTPRFWDFIIEFLKPCHDIINLEAALRDPETLQFVSDTTINYLVDGWHILVSQAVLRDEMLLADDPQTRAMWTERCKPGAMKKKASQSKEEFYTKVDKYNRVAHLFGGLNITYQQRIAELPCFPSTQDGTRQKKRIINSDQVAATGAQAPTAYAPAVAPPMPQ
jgi:hypothetical protein